MSGYTGGKAPEMVRVNVYSPSGQQHVAYHSGLEIAGTEYVFGGGGATGTSGVSLQRPQVPPPGSGWKFYQSVDIAPLEKSREEVQRIVTELKQEFSQGSYDLVSRNCNHFSEALSQRICGKSIPSWVNALAGIGNSLGLGGLIRNAMGQSAPSTGGKADVGAGGLASTGLMTGSVGSDGDLGGEIDWGTSGVLNAQGDDGANSLRSGSLVVSEEDASAELLLLLVFRTQVKLQAVHLSAPSAEQAPSHVRLFANKRNLDMNDAAGGEAPTQDFPAGSITWSSPGPDGAVSAVLDVQFLKFQNLGFLAVHLCREDEDGLPEEGGAPVGVSGLRFLGKV